MHPVRSMSQEGDGPFKAYQCRDERECHQQQLMALPPEIFNEKIIDMLDVRSKASLAGCCRMLRKARNAAVATVTLRSRQDFLACMRDSGGLLRFIRVRELRLVGGDMSRSGWGVLMVQLPMHVPDSTLASYPHPEQP